MEKKKEKRRRKEKEGKTPKNNKGGEKKGDNKRKHTKKKKRGVPFSRNKKRGMSYGGTIGLTEISKEVIETRKRGISF